MDKADKVFVGGMVGMIILLVMVLVIIGRVEPRMVHVGGCLFVESRSGCLVHHPRCVNHETTFR